MLPGLKFRLLCSLQARLKHERQVPSVKGLTLIELLVVIVVIGILAAIASSTFLNAAARARESEAKVNVGAILKAQKIQYNETAEFARNLNQLGVGIADQTRHYEYRTHKGGINNQDRDGNTVSTLAIAIAMPRTDVRGYMGKVWLDTFHEPPAVKSVSCEGAIRETYFMNNKTYCDLR